MSKAAKLNDQAAGADSYDGEHPLHILVVDDNPDQVELLSGYLDRERGNREMVVHQAETADAAAVMLAQKIYDVAFIDHSLAGDKTGLELMEALHYQQSSTPLIFMTSHGGEEIVARAMRRGAIDFINKSTWSSNRIAGALHHALMIGERDRFAAEIEQTLKASEAKYRLLTENATDMIWSVDIELNFTYFSPSIWNLLGYYPDQALTLNLEKLFSPDSYNHFLTGFVDFFSKLEPRTQQGARSMESLTMELQHRRRDGRLVWVEVRAGAIRGEDGRLNGMLCVSRDIGKRKEAEEASRENVQRLRAIYTAIPDLIINVACDGTILSCKPAGDFAQFTSRDFLVGQPVSRILFDEAAQGIVDSITEVCNKSNDLAIVEYNRPVGDRMKYYEARIVASGQDEALIIIRDVSERRQAELERTRLINDLEAAQEELRNQAIRDALTGLFNRRYMEESLAKEISRAARLEDTIGLVMFDLDHFKMLNDTFGHAAGDLVLRELGALVTANVRAEDVACRYGGEEFVVIMPWISRETAAMRAEELRRKVEKNLVLTFENRRLPPITISLGAVVMPGQGTTTDRIVGAADKALYQAKETGRNRVVLYQED